MFKVTYQLMTVTTDLKWAAKRTVSLRKTVHVLLCNQGMPKRGAFRSTLLGLLQKLCFGLLSA